MSIAMKVAVCEVYLRKSQITYLEHEVREREIWKIRLEKLVEARTWGTLNPR